MRRRLAASLTLALCVLAGCDADAGPAGRTAVVTSAAPPPAARPAPALPAPGPPIDDLGAVPDPLLVLRAAVDLSPAVPGVPATATAAVASPDGGAYVVLSTADLGAPLHLATVARAGDGYAVTRSVPIPRLRPVWDVHALANGTVLISGQFRGDGPGYGFLAVDPGTGAVRRAVVIPYEQGTDLASGSSVLSPDEQTITLFLSSFVDGRRLDLLVSASATDGRFRAGRDLFQDVRSVSEAGVGPWSTWLFPRPDGGVHVVFDAYPRGAGIFGVPTLLRYDGGLEPVGGPEQVADVDDSARIRAAAGTPDGTVVLRIEVPDGTWLTTLLPSGASRTLVLALPDPAGDALVVDPAQAWALVPAVGGVRTVDLASGRTAPVDVPCSPGVEQLLPGRGGPSALLLGRCGPRGAWLPMLWVTEPAG